jgi:RNA polymerase sigma-70 factor (ECF subfamily)
VSRTRGCHFSERTLAYAWLELVSAMTTPITVDAGLPAGDGVVLDDATLVARAREGDVRAYEQLVRRYQGPMYRLAVRMLANVGDAEDVVQEVFLSAWRQLVQLQEDAAFVGWLYRTTTNRCLNVIRARRPRAEVELDEHESSGSAGRPERAAETSAQLAALVSALDQLTGEQRACWLLCEVHGRSYDEIANTIGTTSTAVRGRIARARAQLAEVMAPWR